MLKNIFLIAIACLCVQLALAQSFAQQCLDAHNKYRKLHRVPDLVLDDKLTKYAREWAKKLANIGQFQHRPNNKYGENLYAQFGTTDISAGVAVKAWYDEVRKYNFNKPGFSSDTGHFTQVVWKNSRRLGCALSKRGNSVYVVANYDPAGNFIGQFPQNVLQ